MINVETLPDNPALLKALILGLQDEKGELLRSLDQIKIDFQLEKEAMLREHKLQMLEAIRRRYAPRTERFDPTQVLVFGQLMKNAPVQEAAVERESGEKLVTRVASGPKRSDLPASLERIPVPHELPESDRLCPCCGELRTAFSGDVSEQLEHLSARFVVLKHVQMKYVCSRCEKAAENPQIVQAPKAPQLIEKGIPGPALVSHIIVSKLADHLPLYRLERIFQRSDVHIPRSTMCSWIDASAGQLEPLVELMAVEVRKSQAIHTDDTPIPVQDPEVKGKCKKGHIWVYIGDHKHPYVVYDYSASRGSEAPAKWLATYQGFLHADAYIVYDGIYSGKVWNDETRADSIIEVACWAHARRKFYDARGTDGARSAEMLLLIQKLYAIEAQANAEIKARGAISDDEASELRVKLRREFSSHILAEIKVWLDTNVNLVLRDSLMSQAILYSLNQWEALTTYLAHGFLCIDNNVAERAMKRVAIGRKNWLFAGSDHFARNHAILYSLIASAERHGLDPYRYLCSVLAQLPTTHIRDFAKFLPDRWKAADGPEDPTP